MKKQWKKYVGFILIGVLVCCYAKRALPLGRTDFRSIKQFEELGGDCMQYGLPEGSQDVKYYLTDNILFSHSIYAFTIADEAKYDAFMEIVRKDSCNESAVNFPGWGYYCDVSRTYSKEEQAKMQYLQDNHKSMDYKEVLRLASVHKYGFASSYGADVEDYLNMEYSLDEFPIGLPFEEVIADNILDYTILDLYPRGTGSQEWGVLVNEQTHRFVIYYAGQIR